MNRIKKYPLSFLEQLSNEKLFRADKYKIIDNIRLKVSSDKFLAFKESQQCYICGIKANAFIIEKHKSQKNFHISMYHDNILFTIDHVIPRSKGGLNHISNLKTCCINCNSLKKDKILC